MTQTTPVLIVGGGPVGLTMACELLRHGISCRIIDQNAAPQLWSKAAAVQARTMEVFENMGIIDEILSKGRKMFGFRMYAGDNCFAKIAMEVEGTSYPYILGISQRDTELILASHLSKLGGVLEREVKLTSLQPEAEQVRATLTHKDGRVEELSAPWVIACDGAHSTVRQQLNIPFEGSTFAQRLIQADIKASFPFEVDPHEAVAFVSPFGPVGFLPLLSENRYRMIALAIEEDLLEPKLSDFENIVKARCPAGVSIFDPNWMIGFRFHGRIIPQYRYGRVFLAGDAAHIHSPVGAQGMNLGIQDAYNLAWKLAYVIRGIAKDALLDSYDPERRPIGLATVQTTDKATKGMMRLMTVRSSIAQSLRNQAISFIFNSGFFQSFMFRTLGGVDVRYPKSPATGEHHISAWNVQLGASRSGESPTLSDLRVFQHSFGPGARVADFDFEDEDKTLFSLLRGSKHTLFLFDGAVASEEGYRNLEGIARLVKEQYRELCQLFIVIPGETRPSSVSADIEVLLDRDGLLHEHFGAQTECLYLIRPDGRVAFRSQPAEKEALSSYLAQLFIQSR
jgi:2-polyprenyl-6-methoxyphenol hydroxylase-like FAD-dependent oxidoreductase